MIAVIGGVQAAVRIDMSMPKAPDPEARQGQAGGRDSHGSSGISPWEQEAYGAGGRFGSMQMTPSGDPAKDRISVYYRSCAYRVAKDLAGRGREVAFLSVVGNDPLGLAAVADLDRAGVDTSGIGIINAFSRDNMPERDGTGPDAEGTVANGLIRQSLTSIRVEARNFLGDIEFWREDDRMNRELRPSRLEASLPLLEAAEMVFADGSVPEETLVWIADRCRESDTPFYLDPASIEGGAKAGGVLKGLYGIMPGRQEAEAMAQRQILSGDQLMEAGAFFHDQGIRRIVITMKGGGLYYKEGLKEEILRPGRRLQFSETVGAGDVVTAALLDAYARGCPLEEAAREAMEAAENYLADCVDERRY